LTGKVMKQGTNEGVPQAMVEVKGPKTVTTPTDASGMYGLAGLCAGEYTVNVIAPAGVSLVNPNQKVTLDGGNPAKLDLVVK